jgi:monoamine oxidase
MKSKDCTVIIVGAGAAGLMAAKKLAKYFKVVLLEASNRVGGRVQTIMDAGFSMPVEAGAEFVHGRLPLTTRLLKKAGSGYEKLEGKMYHMTKGKWHAHEEIIEGWDQLLKQMRKQKKDITLSEFLQKNYVEPEYAEFRQQVKAYAEGFDLADPSKASVKALYREWSSDEGEVYRIPGGYQHLINYLEKECRNRGVEIFTNCIVKQIDWVPGDVTIYSEDERKFMGEKCVIATPVHIFQKTIGRSAINITPALDEQVLAAREIGYGTVVKVVLEFREAFWNEQLSDLGFVISDEAIPTWWTQLPSTLPLLTGWKGGPDAIQVSSRTDEDILQMALDSLCNIFKIPVEVLKQQVNASKVFKWFCNPYAEGAYSYAYPSSAKARKLLNSPVRDTIYFAGEGVYDGKFAGTVEAALISGKKVAEQLRK